MKLRQYRNVIPLLLVDTLDQPIHTLQNTGYIYFLSEMRWCVITSLQVERYVRVTFRHVAGIGKVLIIEYDYFEAGLRSGPGRIFASVGDAAIQTLPACDLLAARWFWREGQVVQFGEPGLGNAALCLDGEGVAVGVSQVDQFAEWLDGGIATGEGDQDGFVTGKFLDTSKDFLACHGLPFGFVF